MGSVKSRKVSMQSLASERSDDVEAEPEACASEEVQESPEQDDQDYSKFMPWIKVCGKYMLWIKGCV